MIVNPNNEVIATGFHYAAGHAHAEVDALKKLDGRAPGATIYITLEPCCHFGRTPPCTNAIIESGIQHVFYGFPDTNPIVHGKSAAILAKENISCEYVAVPEITAFYKSYQYWHQTKKPFVTAKIALTLDGKIAGENGEPVAITGPEAKALTHDYRKNSDAILTTAKTIARDNPQLNVRMNNETIAKPVYILDRALKLSFGSRIFSTAKSVTLFHDKNIDTQKLSEYTQKNIRCVAVESHQNKLDLHAVIGQIGQDGVQDLWVEAGGTCFAALDQAGLLQKKVIYVAPRWLGTGWDAFQENGMPDFAGGEVTWTQAGCDGVCVIEKI